MRVFGRRPDEAIGTLKRAATKRPEARSWDKHVSDIAGNLSQLRNLCCRYFRRDSWIVRHWENGAKSRS